MIDSLCRPIGLHTFSLGRVSVNGGIGLSESGAWACLITVCPFQCHRLRFGVRWDRVRCTGGLIRNTVKDLSLRGCAKDSVRGQGGSLWMFAIVRDFGLVSSLQFGFVLERQQVGLLLLQALVQPLSLALLLQLPPLELLLQSAGSIRDDEKRIWPYKCSTYIKTLSASRLCAYL